jgi:hypothetical protein
MKLEIVDKEVALDKSGEKVTRKSYSLKVCFSEIIIFLHS